MSCTSSSQIDLMLTNNDFTYDITGIKIAINSVQNAKNWQEKYRQIMLMGKLLPSLKDECKLDIAQVKGCESQAWLYHRCIDNKHYFLADSDARIVNGLIALLIAQLQGQTANCIKAFDVETYFSELGLSGQLSPSRTNGINALTEEIKLLK